RAGTPSRHRLAGRTDSDRGVCLNGLDARQRDGERTPGVDAADGGLTAFADRRGELDELARVRLAHQLRVTADRIGAPAGRGEHLRTAARSAADRHHAFAAEDLTAYVVAVRRAEVRFGQGAGAVVESDHYSGGVEQAGVLKVRGDQRVGGG